LGRRPGAALRDHGGRYERHWPRHRRVLVQDGRDQSRCYGDPHGRWRPDGGRLMEPSRGEQRVRMAILASRFQTIVRRMANTLFRTARSGVLNSGHDFSCVVLTADCRLVAAAESIPIHVMIGPDIIARYVAEMHPQLRRGDAFLHNSPYHRKSHPADHCLVVPIIDYAGQLRFWAVAKAHQADCGNSRPTTYVGDARDVYEEGALIFPAVQIQRDYQDIGDVIRMCRARIRIPEQWWGD